MKTESSVSIQGPKKPSIILKVLTFLLKCLFPIFSFLKINQLLEESELCYLNGIKEDKRPKEVIWFKKQQTRNLLMSMVPMVILLLGMLVSRQVIISNPFIAKGFSKSYELLKARQFTAAKDKLKQAQSMTPTFNDDLNTGITILISSLILAILFGANSTLRNPLIINTNDFRKLLKQQGYVRDDEDLKMLYTPLGAFLELSPGSSAREIMNQERIWSSLGDGVKVGEYCTHPSKTKYVFFKELYKIKEGGHYGYETFGLNTK